MATQRPYPETWQAQTPRAPRVAQLPDGRLLALSEPGFESPQRTMLHLCEARAAQEGLPTGAPLIGPAECVFPCAADAELSAGVWCDARGRAWVVWSDGLALHALRTIEPVRDAAQLARRAAWQPLPIHAVSHVGNAERIWLGSGVLNPSDAESLFIASVSFRSGAINIHRVSKGGATHAAIHSHEQNHAPALAVAPDGKKLHLVWRTEDLRILYCAIDPACLESGEPEPPDPTEVWWYCHHPDVACNGREVVVAYSTHMQHIGYSYFDEQEWHRNLHLTTLHPRFQETLEHSPWLWTDEHSIIHLSFVCLTRRLVYDCRWLGDGFSDAQPVEGLFHPSLFADDVRVPAERMSLDCGTGATLLSSSFLPKRHGVYTQLQPAIVLRPGDAWMPLDMAEVAELRNFAAQLEPMRNEPTQPIIEPTGHDGDFDGARVLNGGTVLKDAGRYRMWYSALPLNTELRLDWYNQITVGYAESDDGIAWRRHPEQITGLDHNACVFVDPLDVPSRRYKAIKFETRAHRYDRVHATGELGLLGRPRRGWLATSGDGLHWQREAVSLDFAGPEFYGWTPQKALYDDREPNPSMRYKAIGFCSMVGRRRAATLAYSADARRWVVAERSPLLDPMAAVTPIRPAGPCSQIHDASMARLGPYLLAFYGYQFDGATEDIRLAVGRDSGRISYIFPETPLIARGELGAWNSGYLMPVDLVVEDDTFVFYYGSSALAPDGSPPDADAWRVCGGRAVGRREGFVRLSPVGSCPTATLLTVPLSLQNGGPIALTVNARLTAGSRLRVGLAQDEAARHYLPGYEPAHCEPITGDSLRHSVRWRDHRHLPANGNPFRVQIVLDGSPADAVYGFAVHR